MKRPITLLKILTLIAIRNLWLHKTKSLMMGGILAFGTFLIVFGLSILHDVEDSMKHGIIQSVAGHLQVYSKQAKDPLALYGGSFMGREDLSEIQHYEKVHQLLRQHSNVKEVVPMGLEMAILGRGNESDEIIDALRDSIKKGDREDIKKKYEELQKNLAILENELDQKQKIVVDDGNDEQKSWIDKAKSSAFQNLIWSNDENVREEALLFLETKIAPLSGEKSPVYLRYLGTDPQLFQKTFTKFKLVRGDMIPQGKRGIMLSQKFMEDFLKIIPARNLDLLHRKITDSGLKISDDAELKRVAHSLSLQHLPILVRLDKNNSLRIRDELSDYLKNDREGSVRGGNGPSQKEEGRERPLEKNLDDLLKQFLLVNDENFHSRYQWFYEHIAPSIRLYEINPGETIILRSYTKNGYVKSVPVKIWGVYSFDGLERSDLAGAFNIIDLVSFRELYGQMTDDNLQELAKIKAQMQVKEVHKDRIEDELFGDSTVIEKQQQLATSDAFQMGVIQAAKGLDESYEPLKLSQGLIINAAIILQDESQLKNTQKELESMLKSSNDKDLNLQVIDWQKASGIVGQFVEIIRYILMFGVSIILLVALVIINNSMIVATFERTQEIGTMRAFGAQRSFILGLFLLESLFLSVIACCIGSFIAFLGIFWLKGVGIPAGHEVVVFLFSGPRLYPELKLNYLLWGPVVVTLLAIVSALYPALFASQIQPAAAMQEKE